MNQTNEVTVIGGGMGGLTAAIAAAESGVRVRLIEAKDRLGGRAFTTDGPFRANWGPHVVYDDGPLWAWLDARGLARPARRLPKTATMLFRVDGTARRLPPLSFARAVLRVRRATAPTHVAFADWATPLVGAVDAKRIADFVGVATFDHDPSRLSAAFVQERVRRTTTFPPHPRYVPGGWATLIERMATHARELGVVIETGTSVDSLPEGNVVIAAPFAAARRLTGDPSLIETGTRTALLDLGLAGTKQTPFIISDLDAPGWVETYSIPDPTLAPSGHHLVQAQAGIRPDESLDAAILRLEALLDVGIPGWREREVWRRRSRIEHDSGALDLPGTTWRDRPAVDRGNGVYLVGDMVAAPGLLGEVSHASALDAVRMLVAAGVRPTRSSPLGRAH